MKFLFARSDTPIYQVIIQEFALALTNAGHQAAILDLALDHTILHKINSEAPDYVVITYFGNVFTALVTDANKFIFELINAKLVFIHHDDIFHLCDSLESGLARINGYKNVNGRSWHFCIEYENYLTLKASGIENAFPILHASEFNHDKLRPSEKYNHSVSFVGHMLPPIPLQQMYTNPESSHYLEQAYWKRVCDLSSINHEIAEIYTSNHPLLPKDSEIIFKCLFISELHHSSQFFRGEIISRLSEDYKIDIFGGDPAYLHGKNLNRMLKKAHIQYHKPTNREQTKQVYSNSRINLNITSLQFDSSVINRVIDVAAVGGFIFTDMKEGLRALTSVWDEISYKTINELNNKIEYMLTHGREREEIASQLHTDIMQKCTYAEVLEGILMNLEKDTGDTSGKPIRLDIGCGPRKLPGYIGVDIDASWPEIDVVADLTRKFPYPDNTVDEVRAHDIVEHLPDRIHTMNEIWRICKPGARVDIRVPSTDGRGAFQDPTHISFWNTNSFLYYSVNHPAYLELCQSYGFEGAFVIESLTEERSPVNVIHTHVILRAVKT